MVGDIMIYKNKKSVSIALTIIISFLLNQYSVKAISIDQGGKCSIKSTYADAKTVEDAIGKSEYLDAQFGTSQYISAINSTIGTAKYCPVYCVETDTFTWPGFKPITQMGEHFTWTVGNDTGVNRDTGLTVNLTGKRECRNNIKLDEWQTDYNKLQEAIDIEEAKLKRSPSNQYFCPPNWGTRGCGLMEVPGGGGDTRSVSAGTIPAILKYPTNENGGPLRLNESFGLLDSNKYVTIYTLDVGSVFSNNTDQSFPIGHTVWSEFWTKYKSLCPCQWKADAVVHNPDENKGSGITRTGTVADENAWALLFGITLPEAPRGKTEYDESCDLDTGTTSVPKSISEVENVPSGGVNISDGSFGINDSTSTVQTVRTLFYGTLNYTYNETITKTATHSHTTSKCSNPAYDNPMTCSMNGGTWKSETTYTCDYKYTYSEPVYKATITSIKQEECIGNEGKGGSYSKACVDLGPVCPTGYHFGTDGKCYKTDVSYLQSLLDLQDTMQNILKDCTNISNSLELDTEMKVDFEEPTYDKTVDLIKTTKSSSAATMKKPEYAEDFPVYGKGVSRTTGAVCTIQNPNGDCRKIIKYQKCSLSGLNRWCWEETKDITSLWVAKYGKVFTVEYEYRLPADFYKYVLIPSGKSVNKAQASSNDFGPYQNFIDVGFPNYPVHYSTPTGTYNLDILYKNIGYQDHFTPYIKTNINSTTKFVTYDCEYDVQSKKLVAEDEEELGAVRLIYRPISLTNPFPSIDGDGRKTGLNWCEVDAVGETKCTNTNNLVEKYILDNRNTTGNEVYNKDPMYKVVLTPALIKEVREYNNSTKYDDYNLYCENGHKCQSEFIKTTFQGIFEGCGASNDFDYCDSTDGYQR